MRVSILVSEAIITAVVYILTAVHIMAPHSTLLYDVFACFSTHIHIVHHAKLFGQRLYLFCPLPHNKL